MGARGAMRTELRVKEGRSPYVVVIEDDQALSRWMVEVFRIAGTRCFAIRSKTSAEHFLQQVRPDLVIVDYQLIGGVGLEAAKIAADNQVPVIITSGHLDIFEREQETGYFYLKKPFTPSELLAVASMLLGANLSFPENQSIRLH